MKLINCIFFSFLFFRLAFCLDFSFSNTIDFGSESHSSLAMYNNLLIDKQWGTTDLYEIHEDGSLERKQRLISYNHASDICIYEDELYIVEYELLISNVLKKYRIADDELILLGSREIGSNGWWIEDLQANADYLFIRETGIQDCMVLDRDTLEEITTISTGTRFFVDESIIAVNKQNTVQGVSGIFAYDIEDIFNPQEISLTILGPIADTFSFYKHNTELCVGRASDTIILDVSDWESPVNEAQISVPEGSCIIDCAWMNNNLVLTSRTNDLWLYDVSDISAPLLLNHQTGLWQNASNSTNANLVANNDHFYIAPVYHDLCHFKASDFPELLVNDSMSTLGIIQRYSEMNDRIAYTRKDSLCWFSNSSPSQKESVFLPISTSSVSSNGDTLCVYDPLSSQAFLFTEYEGAFQQISQTSMPAYYGNALKFLSPYWVDLHNQSRNCYFMNIEDNQFIVVGSCDSEEDIYHCEQPQNLPYFAFQSYNPTKLFLYEKEPPFSLTGSFSIQISNADYRALILSDSYMVLGEVEQETFPGTKHLYLCSYDSDGFEIIDQAICSGFDKTLIFRDGFVITSNEMSNVMQFFKWENDQLIDYGEYEFECQNFDIFLYPDIQKAFICGRYCVQEYTYQPTAADPQLAPPPAVSLSNYPNPFNPSTEIRFQISDASQLDHAQIEIFNARGQKIKAIDVTLSLSKCGAESKDLSFSITWDGTDSTNQPVSSGVYLYQLRAGKQTLAQKKMMLLK